MTPSFLDGSCRCGAVTLRAHLPPIEVYHCHCSLCRRMHAAPFVTWVKMPRAQIEVLSGRDALSSYRLESEWRRFCRTCGTHLLAEPVDDDVAIAWVPRAVLPDGPGLGGAFHKYFESRAQWHEIRDELPRFAENGTLGAGANGEA